MYSRILVALDGSEYALSGGRIALRLAGALGAEIVAAHVYDAGIHNLRFQEMEPVLPHRYQDEEKLADLRDSHDHLMAEGFSSLSRGYMEEYVASVRQEGVAVREVHREGRNYLILLELAREFDVDLVVVGAHGLGRIPDGILGSTALRVLRQAACDVLVTRREFVRGPLIVGIDGSPAALSALNKAIVWARTFQKSLHLTAVYDPYFHDQVFKTMAGSLTPERQAEVGLAKQEELHEQLIDDGLGKLYMTFLDQAAELVARRQISAETQLLQGKVYRSLEDYSRQEEADLIAVGRFGQHREEPLDLGSNSEALVQISAGNVLVTAAGSAYQQIGEKAAEPMEWEADALERLNRLPTFAQGMARSSVERFVRAQGGDRVTLQAFLGLAGRLGMPDRSKNTVRSTKPEESQDRDGSQNLERSGKEE